MPGGRPPKYFSDEERRAADAARKRRARARDVDPSLPERQLDEEPDEPLSLAGPLTPEEEQRLRDEFGYSPSEMRSKAERDATAARIMAALAPVAVDLPRDVAEVWWAPQDQQTAQRLIDAWGLEEFRSSAIHRMALAERRSVEKKKAYLASLSKRVPSP